MSVSPDKNKSCNNEPEVVSARGTGSYVHNSGPKAYVSQSKQRAVKEEHNTEEHEKGPKGRERDPDFCSKY